MALLQMLVAETQWHSKYFGFGSCHCTLSDFSLRESNHNMSLQAFVLLNNLSEKIEPFNSLGK